MLTGSNKEIVARVIPMLPADRTSKLAGDVSCYVTANLCKASKNCSIEICNTAYLYFLGLTIYLASLLSWC